MKKKEITRISWLCREIEKLHIQLRELQVVSIKDCPNGEITMEMLYGKNTEEARTINKEIKRLNDELEHETQLEWQRAEREAKLLYEYELEEVPEGWTEKNAGGAPRDYIWIHNGKSLFDPEYKKGLIKEKTYKEYLKKDTN